LVGHQGADSTRNSVGIETEAGPECAVDACDPAPPGTASTARKTRNPGTKPLPSTGSSNLCLVSSRELPGIPIALVENWRRDKPALFDSLFHSPTEAAPSLCFLQGSFLVFVFLAESRPRPWPATTASFLSLVPPDRVEAERVRAPNARLESESPSARIAGPPRQGRDRQSPYSFQFVTQRLELRNGEENRNE